MMYGPTLVTIVVTHAALSEIDDVTLGGHLARFEKHRGTFERVADIKHQRGVREQSGAVTREAGDLKTFS
jgi:hypothetical protein